MGYGYGSEWQLTRFLGRHRAQFTEQLSRIAELPSIRWLDFEYRQSDWLGDGEILGLDFLPDQGIKEAFREWWPHGSGIMNWDAVGEATDDMGDPAWVLVEAKANIPELRSDCGAKHESITKIRSALDETKRGLGIAHSDDWTRKYYQHANRLAVLHFLAKHGVSAHLVDVFFYGSTASDSKSPTDPAGWEDALAAMKTHLGLRGDTALEARVHTAFIDVAGGIKPSVSSSHI